MAAMRLAAGERATLSSVFAAMRVDPAYYRTKAAQTLKLANKARDLETKTYLLKVAAEYEKLALEVEQRSD